MRALFFRVLWASILIIPFPLLAQENNSLGAPILDVDGDGTSDVGTLDNQRDGSNNELIFQFYLSGSGEYTNDEFGASSDEIALGDYDGDGQHDLTVVTAGDSGESLTWMVQDGRDVTTSNFGISDEYILTGCDFDNDGTTDQSVYNGTSFYYSTTNGGQEIPVRFRDGETPLDATCGDFNGDGQWELVVALSSDDESRLAVYSLDGTELFEASTKTPVSVAVLDMDNDGDLDIATFVKPRKLPSLRQFLQDDENAFSFVQSRIRLGRKGRVSNFTPLYSASENQWSLLYIGRKNRLYNSRELTYRPQRYRDLDSSINAETLLRPTNFTSTGSAGSGGSGELQDVEDGGGGRLSKWGEHGGYVFLHNERCWGRTATSVTVTHQGEVIDRLESTGYANWTVCPADSPRAGKTADRSHWRNRSANRGYYPKGIVLEVKYRDGGSDRYFVANPDRRAD